MTQELLKAFVVGSSLPATLITFTYMGSAFHKGGHKGIDHYEIIPFLVPTILGTLNIGNIWAQKTYGISPTKANTITGLLVGLILSIIGHEWLDLPTRIFNISKEKQFIVHLGAPVLYAGVFTIIVGFLNRWV